MIIVYSMLWGKYFDTGKDTDISTIFSPSKKAWKKKPKATAQTDPNQEKGEFSVMF